jgi:hypothetical protein
MAATDDASRESLPRLLTGAEPTATAPA